MTDKFEFYCQAKNTSLIEFRTGFHALNGCPESEGIQESLIISLGCHQRHLCPNYTHQLIGNLFNSKSIVRSNFKYFRLNKLEEFPGQFSQIVKFGFLQKRLINIEKFASKNLYAVGRSSPHRNFSAYNFANIFAHLLQISSDFRSFIAVIIRFSLSYCKPHQIFTHLLQFLSDFR